MPATAVARPRDARRRGVTINIRASVATKSLIDQAAALLGQNRSEFMLDTVRRRAENVILEQKIFTLDEKKYAEFLEILDNPPEPSDELRRIFSKKAPWEK
ncbi:MAG TPA: DUF1778 domain-containing protein [Stellaceae bacterium]|jgi:uncharacterized protein (DUF1778 family)|nr:DUF1778 domain-containing protein [Stellaceae bacterium]